MVFTYSCILPKRFYLAGALVLGLHTGGFVPSMCTGAFVLRVFIGVFCFRAVDHFFCHRTVHQGAFISGLYTEEIFSRVVDRGYFSSRTAQRGIMLEGLSTGNGHALSYLLYWRALH